MKPRALLIIVICLGIFGSVGCKTPHRKSVPNAADLQPQELLDMVAVRWSSAKVNAFIGRNDSMENYPPRSFGKDESHSLRSGKRSGYDLWTGLYLNDNPNPAINIYAQKKGKIYLLEETFIHWLNHPAPMVVKYGAPIILNPFEGPVSPIPVDDGLNNRASSSTSAKPVPTLVQPLNRDLTPSLVAQFFYERLERVEKRFPSARQVTDLKFVPGREIWRGYLEYDKTGKNVSYWTVNLEKGRPTLFMLEVYKQNQAARFYEGAFADLIPLSQ